jgi:hypothetical protein
MTPIERPAVRLSSPTELLAAVPYLLGFHPTSSLVVLLMDGRRVVLTARLDLPTSVEDVPGMHATVDRLVASPCVPGATGVVLVGYGNAEQVDTAVRAATAALATVYVAVQEALRVADGRFYLLTCTEPGCCPPDGTPFDPTTSIVAATVTAAGIAALPSRNALAAGLAPVTGPVRYAMVEATITAADFMLTMMQGAPRNAAGEADTSPDTALGRQLLNAGRKFLTEAQQSYQARRQVDDEHAAMLTLLLELPSVREYAARHTTAAPWQIEMWTDLVRRAEPDFTTAPATLLALAALLAGNGALADIAVRRALESDPSDGLALLLDKAITVGVDPATLSALLNG